MDCSSYPFQADWHNHNMTSQYVCDNLQDN